VVLSPDERRSSVVLDSQSTVDNHAELSAETIPSERSALTRPQVASASVGVPFYFEENRGQVDEQVKYLARGRGYTVFLTPTETVLALQRGGEWAETWERKGAGASGRRGEMTWQSRLPSDSLFRNPQSQLHNANTQLPEPQPSAFLRMTLTGANTQPQLTAEEALPGRVNYFIGNEPSRWQTEIPTYGKVRYHSVYPGIDVAYYGKHRQVEYDFLVQPGADPNQIRMRFAGAEDLRLDPSGDVILYVPGGGGAVTEAASVSGDRRQEADRAGAISADGRGGGWSGAVCV